MSSLKNIELLAIAIFLFWITLTVLMVTSSCTISFQNISTHGQANDLVDEEQGASADVKADLPKI
jgi:hypothetical protein